MINKRYVKMFSCRNTVSPYIQHNFCGLVSKVFWHARNKVFNLLMHLIFSTSETTVLGMGATSDQRKSSNLFEKLYLYSHKITIKGSSILQFVVLGIPVKCTRLDAFTYKYSTCKYVPAEGGNSYIWHICCNQVQVLGVT